MRIGNCEIFYLDEKDAAENGEGWYYWHCSPGCLPDGEPIGPFHTAIEAKKDAEENGYFAEEK